MTLEIAIIDQGIDNTHDRLKNCVISGVTIYQTKDGYNTKAGEFTDDTGHGTGIAAIIHGMVPEAHLYAVKISSFDKRIRESLLVCGIQCCLANNNVRIINISMGIATHSPSPELYSICEEAAKKGIVISAAAYNYPNHACYPAHFPFVYGVSTGFVKNKFNFAVKQGPIKILAKGTTQRVATLNNQYRISSGSITKL